MNAEGCAHYDHISPAMYDAYVRTGSLSEVICAVVSDPKMDPARASRLGAEGTPHSMGCIEKIGATRQRQLNETVRQWVLLQSSPSRAISSICEWSRHFAAWCLCGALRYSAEDVLDSAGEVAVFRKMVGVYESYVQLKSGRVSVAAAKRTADAIASDPRVVSRGAVLCAVESLSLLGNALVCDDVFAADAAMSSSMSRLVLAYKNTGRVSSEEVSKDLLSKIAEACLDYPIRR